MIKVDEGRVVLKGGEPTLLTEFTILIKAMHNEFGSEMLATVIVMALTMDEEPSKVDLSMLNRMMETISDEEENDEEEKE